MDRSLVVDVFNFAFLKDEEVVAFSDTLSDSSIDVKVTKKEVRGGQGNPIIATLHSGRDITIKVVDPVFRLETLAMQLGSNIKTGAGIGYTSIQNLAVVLDAEGSTKTITLSEAPKYTDKVVVKKPDGTTIDSAKVSITEKKATLSDTDINEGDILSVMPYAYSTDAESEIISISASKYATGGKVVLTTLEIDDKERQKYQLQYVFPNAIPSGDFTIDPKSERDAVKSTTEFTVQKPANSDEIGYIVRTKLGTIIE